MINQNIKIKNALISVYYKNGLDKLIQTLKDNNVHIYSTGGTLQFIKNLNVEVSPVEELTNFPEILGGRVKTLHPKVFGGILNRRNSLEDKQQIDEYKIPQIDLVVVDLYPFAEVLQNGGSDEELIEKIDIGGVSLLRAAAKNHYDVTVVSHYSQYEIIANELNETNGLISYETRRKFAGISFQKTAAYDAMIQEYFTGYGGPAVAFPVKNNLRYGENPHQKAVWHTSEKPVFEKLSGKELSYNNLLDIDAAIQLINEFEDCTFAIIKHNNACGIASRLTVKESYRAALQADTISPFGGILICNREIDNEATELIKDLFFEVIIAPSYQMEALNKLKEKPNRIILKTIETKINSKSYRSILNGMLEQECDNKSSDDTDLKIVTKIAPTSSEKDDLLFAEKIAKHTKSNTIVLVKNKQLLASGVGQTSRVDALKQAIEKAKNFGMDLKGSVMASDAFFPFPDCVEIAYNAGVKSVIQPGGSIKDNESIRFCDEHEMSMVTTGTRHFRH